jgi:hypothetical protein
MAVLFEALFSGKETCEAQPTSKYLKAHEVLILNRGVI